MDQWYVSRGTAGRGPYTRAQLERAASNGSLRVTDMLRQEGREHWIAAGELPGLFPATGAAPAGVVPAAVPVPPPNAAPSHATGAAQSTVPPAAASARPISLPLWWLWAASGAVGLGMLAIASFVILGRDPDHLKTIDPVGKNHEQPGKAGTPGAGTPKARVAAKTGTPKARVAAKTGTPKARVAAKGGTPKARVAAKGGNPRAKVQAKAAIPDVELPPVGPNNAPDANYVWWNVARLASFNYYRSSSRQPLPQEALYLPYRSAHFTATPGPYGGLGDMMTGRSSGAGVNEQRAKVVLGQFEILAATPYPYLQRAIEQAEAICRNRIRLGLADEQFGNTPASSIRVFQQSVMIPGLQYSFLRDADASRLRDSLQRQYPGYNVIVHDAPMSEASREKLSEFFKGARGLKEDTEKRARVSALLGYADMAQVDRNARLWQTWLLPLARRCGGPASASPLVSVEADWGRTSSRSEYQRLHDYNMTNVSGRDLNHVVVELITENEWRDRAAQYYYFDRLQGKESVRLLPHLRFERRRLDFSNTVKVQWSLWADEASEVGRAVVLTSPKPNPGAADLRGKFLGFDRQLRADGEAMGVMMQGAVDLPKMPERQRRLLRKAAAPPSSYIFRLPGAAGRTLVLRFLRCNPEQEVFEAEIVDPGTGAPFDPQSPVWTGSLNARAGDGISFVKKDEKVTSWAFGLVRDDQLQIVCPAADRPGAVFPAREIPLFAVKGP